MSAGAHRKPHDGQGRKDQTKETFREAMERAAHHAQLSLAEAVASARALLDAASIGTNGDSAQAHPHLSEFAKALDQASESLSGKSSTLRTAALSALLGALEGEIARWENRSRTDEDARAVLRAFLGLREFLWELGVRPSTAGPDPASAARDRQTDVRRAKEAAEPRPPRETVRKAPRVQRIKIDG